MPEDCIIDDADNSAKVSTIMMMVATRMKQGREEVSRLDVL